MSCLKPIQYFNVFFSTLLLATAALRINIFQKSTTHWNEKPCSKVLAGTYRRPRFAQKKSPTAYRLFGLGGNIAVSVGTDGVLIVDDQLPELAEKIKAAIAELGSGDIDYNTHWHFDHADGNNAGPGWGDHGMIMPDPTWPTAASSIWWSPNIIKRPTRKRRCQNSPIGARCLCTSTEGRLSYDTFLMHIPMAIRRCFFEDTTLCTLGMF